MAMLKSERITNFLCVKINPDGTMEATPSRSGQSHLMVGLEQIRKKVLPPFFISFNVLRIKNRFNVFYTLLAVVVQRGLTKIKI